MRTLSAAELLLLLLLGLVLFLGIGTHPLAAAILAAVLAAWLLTIPGTPLSPRKWLWLTLGILAGLVVFLGGFLAAPSETAWRQTALNLGLDLWTGANPQPLASLIALFALVPVLLWWLRLQSLQWTVGEMRSLIRGLAALIFLFCLSALVLNALGWRPPWSQQVHMTSWFPNRNQTGIVAASGFVLWLGIATSGRTSWAGRLYYGLGSFVPAAAMFMTSSRGAAIGAALGICFLAVFRIRQTGRRGLFIRLFPAVICTLLVGFLLFGGVTRDRVFEQIGITVQGPVMEEKTVVTGDFRMAIYQDSWRLIRDHFWLGLGPGNFPYVFEQYRDASQSTVGVIHPESDLLWWAAEWGVPATLLLLGVLGFFIWRFRPAMAPPKQSIAFPGVAFAALLPFLWHLLVDVSAHRIGTVFLALFLCRLAEAGGRKELAEEHGGNHAPPDARPALRYFVRAGYLTVCLACIALSLAFHRQWLPSPDTARSLSTPSATYPLEWEPHLRHGLHLVAEDPTAARAYFRRARFLAKMDPEVPLVEGLALFPHAPGPALAAFRTALQRSPDPRNIFRRVMRLTRGNPGFSRRLHLLGKENSQWLQAFWEFAPREYFLEAEGSGADAFRADWEKLRPEGRQLLLRRLNRFQLFTRTLALVKQADASGEIDAFWQERVLALAEMGEEGEAVEWFRRAVPSVSILTAGVREDSTYLSGSADLRSLQASFLQQPDNLVMGMHLIRLLSANGNWEAVRRVGNRFAEANDPPAEFYLLRFHAMYALGDQEGGLSAARAYLKKLE